MLKFKKGDVVRQKFPKAIEGPILDVIVVDGDHLQYEVQGPEGSRFFRDDELEDEAVAKDLSDPAA